MRFQSYASSSSGNLYTVTSGDSRLLLECGLPFQKIREHLEHSLTEIDGCLLTHRHQDHAKAALDIISASVDVYASQPTIEALGLGGHRVHPIMAGEPFTVGGFTVTPFNTVHDCEGSLGFLITDGVDKLLFATDTAYLPNRFVGLTLIAIECNYAEDILQRHIDRGVVSVASRRRLLHSHMELQTVKDCLAANDLSQVREIHLLHLSSGNSNATRFKSEIQEMTGKMVYVAPA